LLNIEKLPDVADPTKLQASIGVREIGFANSTNHPQLQIAVGFPS
jgi:hypothetical protein